MAWYSWLNPVKQAKHVIGRATDIHKGFTGQTQAAAQERANQVNIQLAKENQEFQERMANTAHQRALDDLRRAGLNPMLAAQNPASSPSGSVARVDPVTAKGDAMGALPAKVMSLVAGPLGLISQAKDIGVKQAQIRTQESQATNLDASAALSVAKANESMANLPSVQAKAQVAKQIRRAEAASAKAAERQAGYDFEWGAVDAIGNRAAKWIGTATGLNGILRKWIRPPTQEMMNDKYLIKKGNKGVSVFPKGRFN